MDYIEAFKNLKTNNKYSRKSPHKAILLLSVIEMYETNVLSENMILYDDMLKSTFQKVWERTLKDETLFHPELYLPFWYMQNEDFWHIVPNRGREDILTLLRDSHVKPSEAKLKDCVRYAELDEDLYFLMTLPSGRSSLKRVLLETYTTLSERQIDRMAQSADNAIDYSASALSDYEKILSREEDESKAAIVETDNELVRQFQTLSEDLQIVMNLQYFSFLKSHRNEREMFKEICPTVYNLYDHIVNHPIKQGEIAPSFAFIYDNFLSDLKIALMSEEGSMVLIDNIGEAIDVLRGNNKPKEKVIDDAPAEMTEEKEEETKEVLVEDYDKPTNPPIGSEVSSDNTEIEHVYLDTHNNIIETTTIPYDVLPEKDFATVNRKGKPWTKDEEERLVQFFHSGTNFQTIADLIGRTEVAIRARLYKLGLISSIYDQESEPSASADNTSQEPAKESDFTIENNLTRCSIVNRYGEKVFSTEGKLKYIDGKLYRLNLKNECFTMKSMLFNGSVWLKGEKKIVAYPQTELYKVMENSVDYCNDVESIVDRSVFEYCRLKVKGVWFKHNGDPVNATPIKKEEKAIPKQIDIQRIIKSPLYAVRKQAVLRAMGFFRLPARIRDIARTISRTAWGATIKEEDVEDILNTLSDVESIEGKYILRKK